MLKKKYNELDYDTANKFLRYDPDIGKLYWRGRKGDDPGTVWFNENMAGKEAGSLKRGYLYVSISRVRYSAIRLAYLFAYGRYPTQVVSPKNGDGTDLRKCNLLEETRKEYIARVAPPKNKIYPDKKAAKRAMQRRKRERELAARPRVGCSECGTEFVPMRGRKYVCSDACAVTRDHRLKDERKGRTREPRICEGCGSTYDPAYGSRLRMFCSTECADITNAYTARIMRRGVTGAVQRFNPMTILERDNWRCYICGVWTPQHLRGTFHPNAPELDHIIALADGGDHTPENVACCCRRCNQAKGDGSQSEAA